MIWYGMIWHQYFGIHADSRRTLASISGSESCISLDRGPHLSSPSGSQIISWSDLSEGQIDKFRSCGLTRVFPIVNIKHICQLLNCAVIDRFCDDRFENHSPPTFHEESNHIVQSFSLIRPFMLFEWINAHKRRIWSHTIIDKAFGNKEIILLIEEHQ
jgi:hypothetical protein